MSELYSARVTATGGRQGHVKSEDGILELDLAPPESLGGPGGKTNPEQMFAGGYAACFGNAVIHTARAQNLPVKDKDVDVVAKVGLSPNGSGGFDLSVALETTIAGLDQDAAETLVNAAHQVCPYSNAVRGNIDVALSVKTR
ncbi:organic hydroperoxide resistance protein [Henriciella aquimarina]|uniref:organic hydroperoxide resistance protein n=1 Tax=Henriciella aquimarina TaxID=545261 RepID=UPI000A061652|nr:organic hydroperoxide resistance protein [Henriciella aquimarina]